MLYCFQQVNIKSVYQLKYVFDSFKNSVSLREGGRNNNLNILLLFPSLFSAAFTVPHSHLSGAPKQYRVKIVDATISKGPTMQPFSLLLIPRRFHKLNYIQPEEATFWRDFIIHYVELSPAKMQQSQPQRLLIKSCQFLQVKHPKTQIPIEVRHII